SMAAGHAGLTGVYTPDVAERHTERGDGLRRQLSQVIADADVPFQVTGVGSLMAVHPTLAEVQRPEDLAGVDDRMRELLFLDLLEEGYYIAPRGYVALSLALTDQQLDGFAHALGHVLDERASVYADAA